MPAFNTGDSILFTLFSMGFVAGASERFIPSFISKVEKEEKTNE